MGKRTLWIFASVSWPRLRAECPAIRQPAKHFGVAISTAINWMQRVEGIPPAKAALPEMMWR